MSGEKPKLYAASDAVVALYKINLLKHLSGETVHRRSIQPPTAPWRRLAERYPEFSGKILRLGIAINGAEILRDVDPLPQTEMFRGLFFQFGDGQDRLGTYLMADVLHYRVNSTAQPLSTSVAQEAHALLRELGNKYNEYKDGLLTPSSFHLMDASSVVTCILEGIIRLEPRA